MTRLILFLFLILVVKSFGAEKFAVKKFKSPEFSRDGRIARGESAKAGQFPFFAGVRLPGGGLCSGVLVHERFVMTAQHCVSSVEESPLVMIPGWSNDSASYPEYYAVEVYFSNFYDMAFLKTDRKVEFSPTVKPIRIAAWSERFYMYEDKIVYLAGAGGGHSTGLLQYAKFRVKFKQRKNSASIESYGMPQSFPGSRGGDSGGPLFLYESDGEPTLIGIHRTSLKNHETIDTLLSHHLEQIYDIIPDLRR